MSTNCSYTYVVWHVHLASFLLVLSLNEVALSLCYRGLPYQNTSSRETSSSVVIMQSVRMYVMNCTRLQLLLLKTVVPEQHMIRNTTSAHSFFALIYLLWLLNTRYFFLLFFFSLYSLFSFVPSHPIGLDVPFVHWFTRVNQKSFTNWN